MQRMEGEKEADMIMSGAIKAFVALCQPAAGAHKLALCPAAAVAGRGARVPVCGRQVKEQRVEVEEAVQYAFFSDRDQALAPARGRQRRRPRARQRGAGGGQSTMDEWRARAGSSQLELTLRADSAPSAFGSQRAQARQVGQARRSAPHPSISDWSASAAVALTAAGWSTPPRTRPAR